MNAPLRQTAVFPATGVRKLFGAEVAREYKLYQSNITHNNGPISGFTVGYDPGLQIKLWGGVIMALGIVLMLTMRGVSRELMMFFGLATAVLGSAILANQYWRDHRAPPAAVPNPDANAPRAAAPKTGGSTP